MLNSKLETLNSKQAQMSKTQNSKESGYWLELTEPKEEQMMEKQNLIKEATELTKIFGSIVEKSK